MYHLIVNIDKGEYLDPHAFGEGRHLREFGRTQSLVAAALVWLLSRSNGQGGGDVPAHILVGRWAGDRVVVVGEKCPAGIYLPDNWLTTWRQTQPQGSEFAGKPNLYQYAQACCLDISPLAVKMLAKEPEVLAVAKATRKGFEKAAQQPLPTALIELATGAKPSSDDEAVFDLPEG